MLTERGWRRADRRGDKKVVDLDEVGQLFDLLSCNHKQNGISKRCDLAVPGAVPDRVRDERCQCVARVSYRS